MTLLSDSTRKKYESISTATIASCLFKMGLRNQYIQGVLPISNGRGNMVGPAYTLRYIPAREDRNPITVFKNRDHKQRVAIENCPKGSVLVIDSRKDARAASAGDILITRLMKRGGAGVVTDGGFRDSAAIAKLDIPAFHQRPSAPTNLTLHEAIAVNEPIGCGDVAVFPGDIIVGDDDGVMVIPSELAEKVANTCEDMEFFERFVIEKVKEGQTIIGLYPLTDLDMAEQFEQWKKEQ